MIIFRISFVSFFLFLCTYRSRTYRRLCGLMPAVGLCMLHRQHNRIFFS